MIVKIPSTTETKSFSDFENEDFSDSVDTNITRAIALIAWSTELKNQLKCMLDANPIKKLTEKTMKMIKTDFDLYIQVEFEKIEQQKLSNMLNKLSDIEAKLISHGNLIKSNL